jgi:superfamily I DNA/RNA helicase
MSFEEDRRIAEELQAAVMRHEGEAYVEACPGAGKTRVLVQRVTRICPVLPPRHGIAVLSFTNSAVDEFKDRCREHGILRSLGYPHFIGTFDSFLNQFIVMAAGIPGCRHKPVIVDSWEDIEVTPGLRGVNAAPVSLSRFDPTSSQIELASIRDPRILPQITQYRKHYEASARRRRAALNAKGYLCAADARLVVKQLLSVKTHADGAGKALAARFQEVIVDEAQDCNADDVQILNWLREHKIRLILVCDPDQAIYQFRKGSSDDLKNFIQGMPKLPLTGNFRSSRTICSAAATMRSRSEPDLAVGEDRDAPSPIHLIPYNNASKALTGEKFADIAKGLEISLTDCILLAHKRNLALRASGNPSPPTSLSSRLARLTQAVVAFHASAAGGRQREAALKTLIRLLMDIEGAEEDGIASLSALSLSPELNREYRRKAFEIISRLPAHIEDVARDQWLNDARSILGRTVTVGGGKSLKQCLQDRGDWDKPLLAHQANFRLRCATVHEAKGRDYHGVCLVLDDDTKEALDGWQNRTSDSCEALRVLYVGVTRAKKLLALAPQEKQLAQIRVILDASGIPNQVHVLGTPPKKKKDCQ